MADVKVFAPTSNDGHRFSTTAERQDIVDGLEACMDKLRQLNIISGNRSEEKSERALLLGDVIYEAVRNVLDNYYFESEEELFLDSAELNEVKVELDFFESSPAPDASCSFSEMTDENTEAESSSESDNFEPDAQKQKLDYVPMDVKIRVVNLADKHPKWKLGSLQSKGSRLLKHISELSRWRKHVESGGTVFDKYEAIDKYTFECFQNAKNAGKQVTKKMIQEWGSNLALQHQSDNFNFTASSSWVDRFKQKYGIRTRPVIRYVKSEKVQ